MTDYELILKAVDARQRAYTPYSHHKVGAALETADGHIILGCNVENAGYTPTNCAERTAIFKAVSEGYTSFKRIAIVGGMEDAQSITVCAPCGVCRQVLREFVKPDSFQIILAQVDGVMNPETIRENDVHIKSFTLEELLPLGFGPENLIFE